MAHRIATKIETLGLWGQMLADIVEQFKAISEKDTFDDTDIVMEQLYDWGDQWHSGGSKTCWIATR